MSKGLATIKVSDDIIKVTTPYHERFIADLKDCIPVEDRIWNPDEVVWEVSSEWYLETEEIVSRYFNLRVEVV